VRRTLLYGALGGVLLALLELIEYQHFVRAYPAEVYGGLVAILFTVVGIALGRRWTQPREIVRVREVPVPAEPFVLDEEALRRLAITPRELQILGLIAAGLSNREIGERLFVSENTVKTHASRLFDKLDARRRLQAVQRARELRLVP
jgi:DNA-binding NarL/FixJ family response regulator